MIVCHLASIFNVHNWYIYIKKDMMTGCKEGKPANQSLHFIILHCLLAQLSQAKLNDCFENSCLSWVNFLV